MHEAVGHQGQLLIELIPELELILGPQPSAPMSEASTAAQRFGLLMQGFVRALATDKHPLVLFLDDLQWADAASLNLLQVLLGAAAAPYLLVVGAYRDNEVSPSHPLMLMLDELHKGALRLTQVTLRPLELAELCLLLSDTLGRSAADVEPLAQAVWDKTHGNPFFVNQFLKALHDEQLLTVDAQSGAWRWDAQKIRLAPITDNVVELMRSKLDRLELATRRVLELAACIGFEFDLQTLAVIAEQSTAAAAKSLWPALEASLVLPLDADYQLATFGDAEGTPSFGHVCYRFLHDRVRQAAYSLIPEDQRQAVHLRIGRLLLDSTPEAELEEKLFSIVDHFNLARTQLSDAEERRRLAELNLRAGKKSKASVAYQAAAAYLATGIALLTEAGWESDYELMQDLSLSFAECEYLLGKEASYLEGLCLALIEKSQTKAHKAAAASILCQQYFRMEERTKGLELGYEHLRILGFEISQAPDDDMVRAEARKVLADLGERRIEDLMDLPIMTDPEMKAALDIIVGQAASAWFTNPNVFDVQNCYGARISMKYGNGPHSATCYAYVGMILSRFFNAYQDGYQFSLLGY